MRKISQNDLSELDRYCEAKKLEILNAEDHMAILGTTYYVADNGNDDNDGKSPATPWKTLQKASETPLQEGDSVRFKRGDVFRGHLKAQAGVTYCAYGRGEKPKLYGSEQNLADPALWELCNAEKHIWKLTFPIQDCGTLVFNEGEKHARKLIPSYIGGRFVCRDDITKTFAMTAEMTQNYDLFTPCTAEFTVSPSKGEDFPVPKTGCEFRGELYLRVDEGNPGEIFDSIEALPYKHMIHVGNQPRVTIDNLCLKYVGCHAIKAGGFVEGLHVSNMEIGWIGGAVQSYLGLDPNYPEGIRGSVTRFGNGVEIYGGCHDYVVDHCYIYEIYDAGITHQVTTNGKKYTMTDVHYTHNVIEKCVYSIEYFLEKNKGDTESYMDGIDISHNILRLAGYGWGQQRHNTHTPAHIKGWSYENTASHYTIQNNIFDRSAYRMLHLVAKEETSLPAMDGNTYIQKYGMTLGQYGANREKEPPVLSFFPDAEETLTTLFGDQHAKVYYLG